MKKILILLAILHAIKLPAQDSTRYGISFSGYVESYFSYDFNKPADNNKPGFIYSHNRHNEFNINLAFIRAGFSMQRTRANLALATGTYMNANYSAEPGTLKNIMEANAGYKLSATKNLWLDMGILPSHIGFESAVGKDCWTLTRSILADNTPYFEGGARISYTTENEKWMVSGLALNGWQRITRVVGNSLMSWGTQIQFKPNNKVLLNSSTFFGTDKPDSARTWRYFHNFYGIFQLNKIAGLIIGFDYGAQQESMHSSKKNTWYSPVVILKMTPSEKWAFAFRAEYYSDEHGVIISTGTPNGFKTSGFSLNADYAPATNVLIRIEGKTLTSKDNIFFKEGRSINTDPAISFSTAISF